MKNAIDVAAANANSSTVSVLLGNGNGTFQTPMNLAVGLSPFSVAIGDFNGDGELDLVTANATGSGVIGTISVLLGNGNGTFQPPFGLSAGVTPSYLSVADFNGDGELDLAVANVTSNFDLAAGTISVLLNTSDFSVS
jgi:hypothetical protein